MTDQKYQAGGDEYLYPLAGDPYPLGGAKVLLLTIGGICTVGHWPKDGFAIGWLPLPRRNRIKEDGLAKK